MEAVSERQGAGTARADARVVELVIFKLGSGGRSELFAIALSCVREIVEMPALTAVAGALPPLLGLAKLDGDTINVFDLPAMAGCVPAALDIMLVTESGGVKHGFAVESVQHIAVAPVESAAADGQQAGFACSAIARVDSGAGVPVLAQVLDIGALQERLTA